MIEGYQNSKIGYKSSVHFVKRNNKVLVANTDNGGTVFLTDECYKIINDAIAEKMTFLELIDCIEEEDSKEYMCRLIKNLNNIRAWNYEDNRIRSDLFEISIDLTNKCNLQCKHCCVSAGDNLCGEDLEHDKIMLLIEKIISLNPANITLSGGEPLIRPDFKEIVLFIRKKYKKQLILMTNATLINEDMAAFIAENFDSVDVSIDGSDEKSCSILRGEGTFDKCIRGIKLLQAHGIQKISASMVLTSENEYAKGDFYALCNEMGIYPMVRALAPSGRARGNVFPPKDKQVRRNFKEIKNKFISEKMWKITPQIMTCQGAKIEFQINHIGNIYPCGALMEDEFYLGNALAVADLKKYLEHGLFHEEEGYKNFEKYKPYNLKHCKNCDFGLLCFSCVNDIRNLLNEGKLYEDCKEQSYLYSLYWEDYEGH